MLATKHRYISITWLCGQKVIELCSYIFETFISIDLYSKQPYQLICLLSTTDIYMLGLILTNDLNLLEFVRFLPHLYIIYSLIYSNKIYGVFFLGIKSNLYNGWTGKQGVWSCVTQTHFLCNEIYIVVGVDPIYSLRKFSICSMGWKRAYGR